MEAPDQGFVERISSIVGTANISTAASEMAPYLTDHRKRYTGRAVAAVRPASTEQVAAVVKLCSETRTPIVAQGGNSGLSGGATPDESGMAVVLSLARMNAIRRIDPVGNTVTVEAGCILATLQQSARDVGRLFPLSLAAEGSCTIGGNLATNAGGTGVLRYGNARELCLGIEAVLSGGEVIGVANGQPTGLRKDNTGYDLRDLMIGSEGTLGIITAAVMKLFPLPRAQVTALAAVNSPREALQLLTLVQRHCGPLLTAFELISDVAVALVEKHMAPLKSPFSRRYPYSVLIELSDHEDESHAREMLGRVLEGALTRGVIEDTVVAQSIAQSRALWRLRENISEAQATEGRNIKHDISVPIGRIADFIGTTEAALHARFPDVLLVVFGHLGDGNLHYNVSPGSPGAGEAIARLFDQEPEINRIVYDSVAAHDGSISAEHGIGQLKREQIRLYKPAADLRAMRKIKAALDPYDIMNPGKVL